MIGGEQNRRRQIRVIVADDTPDVVGAVERQLASDCIIVGRASDGITLVECICELRPDFPFTKIAQRWISQQEAKKVSWEIPRQTDTKQGNSKQEAQRSA